MPLRCLVFDHYFSRPGFHTSRTDHRRRQHQRRQRFEDEAGSWLVYCLSCQGCCPDRSVHRAQFRRGRWPARAIRENWDCQYWQAFRGDFVPNTAPMLEFTEKALLPDALLSARSVGFNSSPSIANRLPVLCKKGSHVTSAAICKFLISSA